MANEIQLTAEQIHYINSLPKRTVVFGGKEQTLACDLEKKMAFFLDGIGRPTGRASKLSDSTISAIRHQNSHSTPQGESSAPPDPDIPEPKIVEHESPPDEGARQKKRGGLSNRLRKLAGASDAEISGRDDSDDDGRDVMDAPEEDSEKPKKSKKLWLALIPVVIAVLAVAFAFSPLNSAKSTSGSGTISYGSTTSLSSIDVIQVTRDFIPGDPITEGDIQKATISAEAYNQISLSGATLYQWSRSDSLLNAYAANFIPKGQYLTYENVDSIYHQAVNPWTSSVEDATYITLPLTPELIQSDAVGYGSILDLTITRTTVKTAAAGGEEAENDIPQVPGLEHKATVEQSSLVETYSLTGAVVSDLMNNDKNSLYSTYSTWISIPAGERSVYLKERLKEDVTLGDSMLPTYVQICVTEAQAKALGDLTASGVSVEINATGDVDTSSDAKNIFSSEANALVASIREMMKETAEPVQN